MERKSIVISAVNLTEAGPLSILKDVLKSVTKYYSDTYSIIALVNNKQLCNVDGIVYYEFPESKKSWVKRLYYEYVYFKKFSKKVKPHLWLSLHDMSPRVTASIQAVYCHNTSPYYSLSLNDRGVDLKFILFNFFYKYLYRINMNSNDFVIVQQDWFRNKLALFYERSNIIVAHPDINDIDKQFLSREEAKKSGAYCFFYPTFPRFFKNIEVVCKAVQILTDKNITDFEVVLTISKDDNAYANYIYNKYNHLVNIKFLGRIERSAVFNCYNKANCLLFPSKLESWGLPITEMKQYNKPMLVADLEYAHETVGDYEKACFFEPNDAVHLAELMEGVMRNKVDFEPHMLANIDPPFVTGWKSLFELLLGGKKAND